MKFSHLQLKTIKEAPSDAEIESHKLLVRGGFVKKLAPGIFSYMPIGLKALRKVENIVREEMNRAGALELLMPMVQPAELWQESGRWEVMGKGMAKFKDRNEREFCLGPTHEEVITDIARRDVKSYRDMPVNYYQIQTKFRDEIRPRFGLMRGKEFLMKDAYSFDRDEASAKASYKTMHDAYKRIFTRCGLNFRIVRADAGAIGGSLTQEFQVLAASGEDLIMACNTCDYASNIEITPVVENRPEARPSGAGAEKFATPGLKTIEDLAKKLGVGAESLAKTLFYRVGENEFVCVMLRGSDELNEVKLKNFLNLSVNPEMAHEGEVLQITGAQPGSCGPVGLKIKIYCDNGLKSVADWIVGANLDGFHLKNINPGKDFTPTAWVDLRKAKAGEPCPECGGTLEAHRGIEVGHVFYLGTKYSEAMGAQFLDEAGKSHPCEMGCYGIGVSRTMQAAIEQSNDKDGAIWPFAIAPFQIILCLLDVTDPATKEAADGIYAGLSAAGIDVLYDDRDERAGVKFKDADLLGIPLRVNVGKRSLADGGQVELVERKSKTAQKVVASDAVVEITKWVKAQTEKSS